MHHRVRPQGQGVLQGGGRERVVDHQQGPGGVGDLCPRGDVRDAKQRIGRGLQPQHLGLAGANGRGGVAGGSGRHKAVRDTPLGEHLIDQTEGAAVDVRGQDDVVAGLEDRAQQGVFCGHAGGERERTGAALHRGELFLESAARGVGTAAVLVATGAELVDAVLHERGGLVDRRDHGAGGPIRFLPGVNGACGQAGQREISDGHGRSPSAGGRWRGRCWGGVPTPPVPRWRPRSRTVLGTGPR